MSAKSDVYTLVTERMIALLERGVIPWRRPWAVSSPKSLVSGLAYRGINMLLLSSAPYRAAWWLTYRQARERGGYVRRGEAGYPLVFWKRVEKRGVDQQGEIIDGSYVVLRHWTVFNVEQCEGIEYPRPAQPDTAAAPDCAQAAQLVAAMPQAPLIRHGGQQAFYLPAADRVHMPQQAAFETQAAYYSVLFHELIHSTGHPTRLNRPEVLHPRFGSDPYAREELVAEMGAALLCTLAGIASDRLIENQAAYLANWLTVLRSDRRLVVQAAAAAQKAADFISAKNVNSVVDDAAAFEADPALPARA